MRRDPASCRTSKRELIQAFFTEQQLGQKFRTDYLHGRFGTAFRARVSELNHNVACPITILNSTKGDSSFYWAVSRKAPESLFGDLNDLNPARRYPD